jgi:hypothetical protein
VKKDGACTPSKFVELHRKELALVCAVGDLNALCGARGTWLDHSEVLNRVVQASKVGHGLFSFALASVMDQVLAKAIDEQIENLMKEERVTLEKVAQTRSDCIDDINELPNIKLLADRCRRQCFLSFV